MSKKMIKKQQDEHRCNLPEFEGGYTLYEITILIMIFTDKYQGLPLEHPRETPAPLALE